MRMLYKYPGTHKIHNDMFSYVIVPESEVQRHIEDGWSYTTEEAKNYIPKAKKQRNTDLISPKDLSPELKNAIAEDERSQAEVAKIYNVSRATVSKIQTGKL